MSLPVYAIDSLEPLLNKVVLQLQAEQWITTKTALVNVIVNAAVADRGIEKIQNDVMQKLKQLADGDWHILSYDRQLDRSGLESLQIVAQARLMQNQLGNLRDKAKAISKPGETYTIDAVQFTPSDEEIRQANFNLRQEIYQQAKLEMDTLNKTYTDQKFYVHEVNFIMQPMTQFGAQPPQTLMARTAAVAEMKASPPLTVGNKAQLQATIIIAAMPDLIMQKLNNKTSNNSVNH